MSTVAVKGGLAREVVDVGLLRQRAIVQLLSESSLQPHEIAKCIKDYIQQGVLTQEVCPEVRLLFARKGLTGCRLALMDDAAGGAGAPCAPGLAPAAATSRFETEFERLELLGRGGFGEVWRARNRIDQREYAVKMIQYRFNADEGPLKHAALREAQAWAAVRHPNVVGYHAAWVEVDGQVEITAQTEPQPQGKALGASNLSTRSYDTSFGGSDGGVVFESSSADESSAGAETPLAAKLQIVPQRKTGAMPGPPMGRATLYVQTELVRGGTLREWIDKRNEAMSVGEGTMKASLPRSQAAEDIFLQILDALAYLHSHGLVHRDIKPANILLTETGSVRLGDFGLAKSTRVPVAGDHPSEASLADEPAGSGDSGLQHTRAVGTPTYASPEQLRDGHYGVEVDIYALGVVLAELLFPVQTHMERAELFEGMKARRLPSTADDSYPGAAELVLKMTHPDPAERPTAAELLSSMRRRRGADAQPHCGGRLAGGDWARDMKQLCVTPA